MAVVLGIEPSSILINSQSRTPCSLYHNCLVEDERIELSISACKADVIPFN